VSEVDDKQIAEVWGSRTEIPGVPADRGGDVSEYAEPPARSSSSEIQQRLGFKVRRFFPPAFDLSGIPKMQRSAHPA
jgi:hypothetical protein